MHIIIGVFLLTCIFAFPVMLRGLMKLVLSTICIIGLCILALVICSHINTTPAQQFTANQDLTTMSTSDLQNMLDKLEPSQKLDWDSLPDAPQPKQLSPIELRARALLNQNK